MYDASTQLGELHTHSCSSTCSPAAARLCLGHGLGQKKRCVKHLEVERTRQHASSAHQRRPPCAGREGALALGQVASPGASSAETDRRGDREHWISSRTLSNATGDREEGNYSITPHTRSLHMEPPHSTCVLMCSPGRAFSSKQEKSHWHAPQSCQTS